MSPLWGRKKNDEQTETDVGEQDQPVAAGDVETGEDDDSQPESDTMTDMSDPPIAVPDSAAVDGSERPQADIDEEGGDSDVAADTVEIDVDHDVQTAETEPDSGGGGAGQTVIHDDGEPLIDDETEPPTDVRDVLAELGAEGELARIDTRIREIQRDLERTSSQVEEASRARRGEMEVMRARLEDALDLVESTTSEQREVWSQLEERFASLASEVEDRAGRLVNSLRDELTPRVHRVALQSDELEARLRGEIESATIDLKERLDDMAGTVDANRSRADEAVAELRASLTSTTDEHAEALADLENHVTDKLEKTVRVRFDEMAERVEGLRRELDGAVGELRASQNLRTQTMEEQVNDLREELEEHVETMNRREADWAEAAREAIRRAKEAETVADGLVQREREARSDQVTQFRDRLEELGERLEQVDGRAANQTGRHLSELGQLHRTVEELSGRVEVLGSRVSQSVDDVAGDLHSRVASLGSELDAVRESAMRQEERLATTDRLSRRVGEVEARQDDLDERVEERPDQAEQVPEGLGDQLADISDRLSQLEKREPGGEAVARLDAIAHGQEALRREVRELAVSTSELNTRVEEAESLARAAGRAIAGAVRRSRGATDDQPQPPDQTQPSTEEPSVPETTS